MKSLSTNEILVLAIAGGITAVIGAILITPTVKRFL
jgi:hypothetical protein